LTTISDGKLEAMERKSQPPIGWHLSPGANVPSTGTMLTGTVNPSTWLMS
jgi:hypothetical protein